MGVFDNMKSKLGFGGQPEWQEEPYQPYDEAPYDDYGNGQPLDDGYDVAPANNDLLSFDSYNPDNFAHVNLNSDREIKVASMGDSDDAYFSSHRSSGYGSNIGTSASRSSNVRSFNSASSSSRSSSSWDSPESPAFRGAADFVNSISSRRNNPAEHLAIVKAYSYGDAEDVGTSLREGKVVVLVLTNTRPELAKRILDFSFGAASVLNATVDKLAEKVFVISRGAKSLMDAETDYLHEQGVL
mgnify:FL=1